MYGSSLHCNKVLKTVAEHMEIYNFNFVLTVLLSRYLLLCNKLVIHDIQVNRSALCGEWHEYSKEGILIWMSISPL